MKKLIVEMLQEILESQDEFTIECANNGMEGLTLVEKNKYDLILVDFRMPIMDGSEFAKILRSGNTINANTPLLFVTANPEMAQESVLILKNCDVLKKPIIIETLVSNIKKLIDNKNSN